MSSSILFTILQKLDRILNNQVVILKREDELAKEHKLILKNQQGGKDQLDAIQVTLAQIQKQQQEDGDVIRQILEILQTPPLPAPPPITEIRLVAERQGEGEMATKLDYEAKLPAVEDKPENKDVIAQRVKVFEDGTETSSKDEPRLADVTNFSVTKGVTVKLTRQYLDDDGNEGPVTASQEFVAKDTIAPGAPGDFGEITLLGEREE